MVIIGLVVLLVGGLAVRSAVSAPRSLSAPPPPSSEDTQAWTVYRDALLAEGTLAAAYGQMTATANADAQMRLQSTQAVESHRATSTAQAQSSQATSTAQAQNAIATTTALALSHQASATAQTEATQAYFSGQLTQQAVHALATVQSAEAELAVLAAERERVMNQVAAAAPWIIVFTVLLVSLSLLIVWARQEIARRKVLRDRQGRVTHIVDVDPRGKTTLLSADRMPGPTVTIDGNTRLSQTAVSPESQQELTALAMLLDLIRSMSETGGTQGKALFDQIQFLNPLATPRKFTPGQVVDVQIIENPDDPEIQQWILDVQDDFLAPDITSGT
jgi:hypothetical protein